MTKKIHGDYILQKEWQRGRFLVGISWRSGKGIMGRFGGGWQSRFHFVSKNPIPRKLGLQGSWSTVILSLLILEIRISWYKPE